MKLALNLIGVMLALMIIQNYFAYMKVDKVLELLEIGVCDDR